MIDAIEDELRETFSGMEVEGVVELDAPQIARYVLRRVLNHPVTMICASRDEEVLLKIVEEEANREFCPFDYDLVSGVAAPALAERVLWRLRHGETSRETTIEPGSATAHQVSPPNRVLDTP